jgi:hypothetical protein
MHKRVAMLLVAQAAFLLCASLVPSSPLIASSDYVNSQLPWHPVVLDSQGRLLAWYKPENNLGYDKVMRLAWDLVEHKIPVDVEHGTGLRSYLIHTLFDERTLQGTEWWQHNPANVYAMFVDSLVSWYPYSDDEEAVQVVREMLDYQLAHGTTPADWEWRGVPFASSCDSEREFGRCMEGMPREFYGGIETDKVGELGLGYLLFYEMTGERKYLDAAINCGEALARHARPGDAEHAPWPFRVNARTDETLLGQEYGGMIVAPVRLFEELIRLRVGNVADFEKARDAAWKWILDYPLNSESRAWDKWSGYFGDVGADTENVNQALPTMTAYYILSREDPARVDRDWMNHVGHLLDWVRKRFGRGPYFGAWGIDEQGRPDGRGCCSRAGLGSDTSRWGAINAMYYEKTGDAQAREDAFRSLNYATYFADSEGKVSCCGLNAFGQEPGGEYEFDDGYGDYVRNYMWALGAVPAFAPKGENHLLHSSSPVQKVSYGQQAVTYRTFDPQATEALRLNFKPTRVLADDVALVLRNDLNGEGYTVQPLEAGDCVVRVRHLGSNQVSITAK